MVDFPQKKSRKIHSTLINDYFVTLRCGQYCVHSLSVHVLHLRAMLLTSQKRSGYLYTQYSQTKQANIDIMSNETLKNSPTKINGVNIIM